MNRISFGSAVVLALTSFVASTADTLSRDLSAASAFYSECSTPQRDNMCIAYTKGLYEGIVGARLDVGASAIKYTAWRLKLDHKAVNDTFLGWGFLPMAGTPSPWFPFCTPGSAAALSYSDLTDIVVKYLKDNPEKRTRKTSEALILSLSASYPCESEEEFEKRMQRSNDDGAPRQER
jgi:hypothetical protein